MREEITDAGKLERWGINTLTIGGTSSNGYANTNIIPISFRIHLNSRYSYDKKNPPHGNKYANDFLSCSQTIVCRFCVTSLEGLVDKIIEKAKVFISIERELDDMDVVASNRKAGK